MKRAKVMVAVCALLAGAGSAVGEEAEWPSEVKGFVPVELGEHPRLVFRKTDVPALRKRAVRPEGNVMLGRIRDQLNAPFTVWHAAGYAFLYQVTGEDQFAAKAFEAAQQTLSGKANPDGRYTWPGNGQLRAGPCLSGMGLAYDMAYGGWAEDQRQQVVDGIVANKYLEEIAHKPRHCPGCNHWGAHTGGAGVALLALRGDPGIDAARIEALLAKVTHNAKREILEGHGKRGYYYEGHHCGRLSNNTGLLLFIQAYRTAAGKDLVGNCDNARWLTAKWIYEFVDHDGPGKYTYNSRGMYRREFGRGGMSGGGDFAHGFGICPDEYKPAVLWLYNHIIEPGAKTYDLLSLPHRGPYAFVNWPLDMEEGNPGEMFPRVLYDEGPGYCVFRNGWKDSGNIVVTALLGSNPPGGRGMAAGGSVEVCGRGLKYVFPGMFHHTRRTYFRASRDGSGVVSAVLLDKVDDKRVAPLLKLGRETTSLAVDFSGASGAELLVAQVGAQVGHNTEYWLQVVPAQIKDVKGGDGYYTKTVRSPRPAAAPRPSFMEMMQRAEGGEVVPEATKEPAKRPPVWYVMTLQKGPAPEVRFEDNRVFVGGQALTFDGRKIALAKMSEELPEFSYSEE